jgi:hypothetical protein
MCFSAILGAGSALLGASSSRKAAKAQEQAAQQQLAVQQQMFNKQSKYFAPYRDAGENALGAYNYEMGMGDMPEGYGGYTKAPGYDFRMQQGTDAVNAGVGARHGLNSGAALQSLNQWGMDYSTGEYDKHVNRLRDMVGVGQNSAAMTGTAAGQYAQNASNSYANIGNAQAAGAIGVNNAIQGGINNGLSLWAYGKGQGGNTGGNNGTIWNFGG